MLLLLLLSAISASLKKLTRAKLFQIEQEKPYDLLYNMKKFARTKCQKIFS